MTIEQFAVLKFHLNVATNELWASKYYLEHQLKLQPQYRMDERDETELIHDLQVVNAELEPLKDSLKALDDLYEAYAKSKFDQSASVQEGPERKNTKEDRELRPDRPNEDNS
jgi:predicted  nucleic acid-binding Zn-ribbon protein